MNIKESKKIGLVVINKVASAVDGLNIDEAFIEATKTVENNKDGWWIYKGGSHIALMAKSPITGESERYAMYV